MTISTAGDRATQQRAERKFLTPSNKKTHLAEALVGEASPDNSLMATRHSDERVCTTDAHA
jgi:hypothetical protein